MVTHIHAAVRLACVRHAASVQSEPGSNSSIKINFTYLFWPQTPSYRKCSHKLFGCSFYFLHNFLLRLTTSSLNSLRARGEAILFIFYFSVNTFFKFILNSSFIFIWLCKIALFLWACFLCATTFSSTNV